MRVEDCGITLDIRQLLPDGRVVEGSGIARVGENSLAYRVIAGDEPAVDLAFTMKNGAETIARRQQIALVPSWRRFEALGFWFSCPCCGRRVTKAYLPHAHANFACRRCSGLIYTSVQTHDARVDRFRRDPRRVAAILSGSEVANETVYMLAMKAGLQGAEARCSSSR